MLIRESREFTTIANIAIRFKLEEMDPEGKARDMIKGGLLSGLPVDERFFYVFCECLVLVLLLFSFLIDKSFVFLNQKSEEIYFTKMVRLLSDDNELFYGVVD